MNTEMMNVAAMNYDAAGNAAVVQKMKGAEAEKRTLSEKAFMVVSIAACLSMFLPWFSFNPAVTGYMWGFDFLPHWVVPISFILAYHFFLDKRNKACVILMELSLLAVPCVLLYDMAAWHFMGITGEVSLQIGLTTAQPGFWVAAGLSVASFLAYQATLLNKR